MLGRVEALRLGDPERRLGFDADGGVERFHVVVDRVGVVGVHVDAGHVAAVVEHGANPRRIVVAHRLMEHVHALEVEEDRGAAGEAFARRRLRRVDSFAHAARAADEIGIARCVRRRRGRLAQHRAHDGACDLVAALPSPDVRRHALGHADTLDVRDTGPASPRLLADVEDGEAVAHRGEGLALTHPALVLMTRALEVVARPRVGGVAGPPGAHGAVAGVGTGVEAEVGGMCDLVGEHGVLAADRRSGDRDAGRGVGDGRTGAPVATRRDRHECAQPEHSPSAPAPSHGFPSQPVSVCLHHSGWDASGHVGIVIWGTKPSDSVR